MGPLSACYAKPFRPCPLFSLLADKPVESETVTSTTKSRRMSSSMSARSRNVLRFVKMTRHAMVPTRGQYGVCIALSLPCHTGTFFLPPFRLSPICRIRLVRRL